MSGEAPQVFPIQGLSLACLLAALVLALVINPVEQAGVAGVDTGAWTYAWHALALGAGIAGIVTARRWTIPLVLMGAAGAVASTTPPEVGLRALASWLVFGVLVFLHLELRDGAARVSAWARAGGEGVEVGRIGRSYLRRVAGASAASVALAFAALTFPSWGTRSLPAPVAHGVELQGVYGLLLGIVLVFGLVVALVGALHMARAWRRAA